ncbi:hypothetical protein FHR81_003173 [Actinoalloteichus hoggarensis]|uniref:Uncharacterized protein n=1 Tax=Actinoalloteichus hoggarensis TaxID=1470176 RepID=A0A221W6E3_9PSEU|nr:hypothetical protein [Actinoalloteichus hoggarensis]ASO21530.1 hypothetical protein AHOG_19540 [Actinoalloteichus hoggarensis]MBB5922121.1 hypothetical protein [Actinoalloteichus hoggarensis]
MRPPVPPSSAPRTPDSVEPGAVDLSGLDAVDWARLKHGHGSADDVPGLIRALAADPDDWAEVLDELIGDDLLHQGSCYSACPP